MDPELICHQVHSRHTCPHKALAVLFPYFIRNGTDTRQHVSVLFLLFLFFGIKVIDNEVFFFRYDMTKNKVSKFMEQGKPEGIKPVITKRKYNDGMTIYAKDASVQMCPLQMRHNKQCDSLLPQKLYGLYRTLFFCTELDNFFQKISIPTNIYIRAQTLQRIQCRQTCSQ